MLNVHTKTGTLVVENVKFYTYGEADSLPIFTKPVLLMDTRINATFDRTTNVRTHGSINEQSNRGFASVDYPEVLLHSTGKYAAIVVKQSSDGTMATLIVDNNTIVDVDIEVTKVSGKGSGYNVLVIPLGLIVKCEKLADAKYVQKRLEQFTTALLNGDTDLTRKQFSNKYGNQLAQEARSALADAEKAIKEQKEQKEQKAADKANNSNFFSIKLSGKRGSDSGMSLVVDKTTGYVVCKTDKPDQFVKDVEIEGIVFVEERIDTVPHVLKKLTTRNNVEQETIMRDDSYHGRIGVYKIGKNMTVRCQNKLELHNIAEYDPNVATYEYHDDAETLYNITEPRSVGLYKKI